MVQARWRYCSVTYANLTEIESHQFVNPPEIPVIFINFFDFDFAFFGYSWSDCNSLILILLQISFLKIFYILNTPNIDRTHIDQTVIVIEIFGPIQTGPSSGPSVRGYLVSQYFTLSFRIEGSFVGCFIVQLVPQSRILFKCFLYFLLEKVFYR